MKNQELDKSKNRIKEEESLLYRISKIYIMLYMQILILNNKDNVNSKP